MHNAHLLLAVAEAFPSMQFSLQVISPPKPSGFIYSEDEEKWFWLVFLLWLYASEYLSPDSLSWLVHLKIRLFSSIAYGLK